MRVFFISSLGREQIDKLFIFIIYYRRGEVRDVQYCRWLLLPLLLLSRTRFFMHLTLAENWKQQYVHT